VHLDVTDPGTWQRAVEATCESWDGLDVLVNNAGVLLLKAIADTTAEDFDRVVGVNQKGAFLGIQAVIEPMKSAARGSIVNISSIDGQSAKNGLAAYASSKWALRGLTRVAALELGKFGIRVNAVCPEAGSAEMMSPYIPDGIDVEMIAAHSQPLLSTQRDRKIVDRLGDIARLVAFLASDASASCTGSDFLIDGGNLAGTLIPGTPGS
jgi:3alpha(or 20beta)-hydroxysteroid dehydrogenase